MRGALEVRIFGQFDGATPVTKLVTRFDLPLCDASADWIDQLGQWSDEVNIDTPT